MQNIRTGWVTGAPSGGGGFGSRNVQLAAPSVIAIGKKSEVREDSLKARKLYTPPDAMATISRKPLRAG